MDLSNRIGEIGFNNFGTKMIIIEYYGKSKILVEFQDEYKYKVKTTYGHFKDGKIKNLYDKTIYEIGYLGEGKYNINDENNKKTKAYICWRNMIKRCYCKKSLKENPQYEDVFVCEEWLCFQNFAEWFYSNYYEINDEVMCLDKDILIKGNRVYSPSTCIFVPSTINQLFPNCKKKRGYLPLGVVKADNKYGARVRGLKKEWLGRFNTIEEAFISYKIAKEEHIKEVADTYKDLIPKILYEAMYKWEVEIND